MPYDLLEKSVSIPMSRCHEILSLEKYILFPVGDPSLIFSLIFITGVVILPMFFSYAVALHT